jgi:uncharacterized membrane protein
MLLLSAGLLLFLGIHTFRVAASGTRDALVKRWGEGTWKGVYSLVSAIGLGLIVYGYSQARLSPIVLWAPPLWTRHLALLLMVPFFMLLAAAYVPGTRLKAAIGHPMVASVKLWALAHLLANGNAADVLLFASFLVWAVIDFISLRRRDRSAGRVYPSGDVSRDLAVVVIGAAVWAVFVFYLHRVLIGVALL